MTADAQLFLRTEPWGRYVEWKGGHYAEFYGDEIGRARVGDVVSVYNLRLRLIAQKISVGTYRDVYYVARANDPIAELKVLANTVSLVTLKFIYRCESAVMAFRLKYNPNSEARFTSWLAKRIL